MSEVTANQPEVNAAPAEPPKAPPMKKKPRSSWKKRARGLVVLALVLGLLGGGGYLLYRFLNTSNQQQGEIWAEPASIGTLQSKVSGSGTAKAKESAAITLTASGTVQEVFVTGGQTVTAGEPLYTIYSQAAEEAVTNARKRVEDLSKDMADLQKDASNLTVRAPFSGKLQNVEKFERDADVGKGCKVAELVNDRQLKLELYFSYAYENAISVGQEVEVSIPVVMRTFPGRVEKINRVSFISPEGAAHFQAVIVFDNPGTLTAGMEAAAVLHSADGEIYPYSNGSLEFYETHTVVAKASGPVVEIGNLLNYANVEAGEPLLYLGSDSLDSDIRAKQTEIDEALQKLTEAEEALEDFNAVAPIDGTVTSCTLTPGAEVKSGDTVVIISNNTTMLVTIQVDDRNISFIKPQDTVDLDWNGNIFQGIVTSIDMGKAESSQGMTQYPVTLSVDNWDGSLMDGAWLQYSFVTSESEGCVLVPSSAVQYYSDLEGNRRSVVFVLMDTPPESLPELDLPTFEPGQTRRFPPQEEGYYPVLVETGLADVNNVEIISGVQEGDMVFVHYTVTEGSW